MDALKLVQRYGGPQVQFSNILRELKHVGAELARKRKMLRVVQLAKTATAQLTWEQQQEAFPWLRVSEQAVKV